MSVRSWADRGLRVGVKSVAASVDRFRPPPPGVVVLIYHRVGGRTASEVDLPSALFEAQVAELSEAGRLVSLDAAVDLLTADPVPATAPSPSPVVLTFDDGTDDWVTDVLPVLDRHRAPATFYVGTDFVERGRPWPGGGRPVSWGGLGELVGSGLATLGSHTDTHALLDRLEPVAAAAELDASTARIEDRLGVECRHFAYPKTLVGSPAVEAEVRRRFRSAAVGGGRANPYGATDVHRLARTAVQVTDGMRWFRRKAAGGLRLEDDARSLLNRRRYASATA